MSSSLRTQSRRSQIDVRKNSRLSGKAKAAMNYTDDSDLPLVTDEQLQGRVLINLIRTCQASGLLIRTKSSLGLTGDEAEHRDRCERLAALSSRVHKAYGSLRDIAMERSRFDCVFGRSPDHLSAQQHLG